MAFAVFASLKQNDPYTFTNSWTLPCINKLELPKNPEQRVETASCYHSVWEYNILVSTVIEDDIDTFLSMSMDEGSTR